ncbi:MAG: sugar phosphate isomerase/epimerase family protein [Opitutaceae bacterium]
MRIGICADPATLATLPPPLPFDFIEGHVQNFLKPEASDPEFSFNAEALRNCARSMPAANSFLPSDLRVTGPLIDYPRLDRYAETTFRRAAQIGMNIIVFDSADARHVPDGFPTARAFEQFVDVLRHFALMAEKQGVTLVVKPLHRGECNFINTLAEAAEAVERVAHPHVKLIADSFQMARSGESPEEIIKFGSLIHHTHVAENHDRAPPGVSQEDLRPFLRALKKIGFDDRLTIEAIWTKREDQVAPAAAALRAQLAATGHR